jgi:hypothetical protein
MKDLQLSLPDSKKMPLIVDTMKPLLNQHFRMLFAKDFSVNCNISQNHKPMVDSFRCYYRSILVTGIFTMKSITEEESQHRDSETPIDSHPKSITLAQIETTDKSQIGDLLIKKVPEHLVLPTNYMMKMTCHHIRMDL